MSTSLNPQAVALGKKGAIIAVGLFLALIVGCGSCFSVSAGEVGVLFNSVTGNTKSYSQGMYLKLPFVESVTDFDVRIQKMKVDDEGTSKDLQVVKYETIINYHLDFKKVNELYVSTGEDYAAKLIVPAVNDTLKAITALYPVEDIIVKRHELKMQAEEILTKRLAVNHIVFDALNIVDIDFSPEFNKVVEEKQIEEQKIKTAQYIRQQAVENKKTTILDAEAEAQKQNLLRQTTSREVIALKWIEAWKAGGSHVPQIMAGKNGMFYIPANLTQGTGE